MNPKEQQPDLSDPTQNSSQTEDSHRRSRLNQVCDRINDRIQPLGIPGAVIITSTATTEVYIALGNKPTAMFSTALLGIMGILAYRTGKKGG